MTCQKSAAEVRRSVAGFTLIEALIVLGILAVILGLGLPALNNMIARSKLEGQARTLSVMLGRARNEAVTQGAQTVVHVDGDEFVSFVDRDGANEGDPADGIFNPLEGAAYKASDWQMATLRMDSQVSLAAPSGEDAIEGLVNTARPDERVIFNPDGSVLSTGAFRLTDPRGNYLEVAVGPLATGQVTIRKWDGSAWREQDEGGKYWVWN